MALDAVGRRDLARHDDLGGVAREHEAAGDAGAGSEGQRVGVDGGVAPDFRIDRDGLGGEERIAGHRRSEPDVAGGRPQVAADGGADRDVIAGERGVAGDRRRQRHVGPRRIGVAADIGVDRDPPTHEVRGARDRRQQIDTLADGEDVVGSGRVDGHAAARGEDVVAEAERVLVLRERRRCETEQPCQQYPDHPRLP